MGHHRPSGRQRQRGEKRNRGASRDATNVHGEDAIAPAPYFATRISFLLTNSSIPYGPSSRPKPERLTPPNGSSAPSRREPLTKTMPASISLATRSACSASVVNTYEPRPNGVSFATRTASSSDETL